MEVDKDSSSSSNGNFLKDHSEDRQALLDILEDSRVTGSKSNLIEEVITSQTNGSVPVKSIESSGARNCNFEDFYYQACVGDDFLKNRKSLDQNVVPGPSSHTNYQAEDLTIRKMSIPNADDDSIITNLKRKINNSKNLVVKKKAKLIIPLPLPSEPLEVKPVKKTYRKSMLAGGPPRAYANKKVKKSPTQNPHSILSRNDADEFRNLHIVKPKVKSQHDSNKIIVSTCQTQFEHELERRRIARNEAKRRAAHLVKKKLQDKSKTSPNGAQTKSVMRLKNSLGKSSSFSRPCPKSMKKTGSNHVVVTEEKVKMKHKCVYTEMEKSLLTQNGQFFIEKDVHSGMRNATVKKTDQQIIFRIGYNYSVSQRGSVFLQKYMPVEFKGRLFHMCVDVFRTGLELNNEFWEKYQPVCVKQVSKSNDGSSTVMQYFPNEGLNPYLGKLSLTCSLAPTYELFLQVLLLEAIKSNFIKENVVGKSEPKYAQSWIQISSLIEAKIDSILNFKKTLVMKEITPSLMDFPIISIKHASFTGSREPCLYCNRKKIVGTFKILFTGDKYDPFSFDPKPKEVLNQQQMDNIRHCCVHCKDDLQILSRLMHHKIFAFVCCRSIIKKLAANNPGKNKAVYVPHEIANYLLNDFDWVQNMFHDFQVLLAEADKAVSKLEKDTAFKIKNAEDEYFANQSFKIKEEIEEPVSTTNEILEGSSMLHINNDQSEITMKEEPQMDQD